MWLCISFPTCDHSPTRLVSQWSCFSSSDGCDPVCVGRNSGEDCWCGRMAVTAAPAHNTDELVLSTLTTLQRSSRISLQPAKRKVHSPDCMIPGGTLTPNCRGWSDKSVSLSPITTAQGTRTTELVGWCYRSLIQIKIYIFKAMLKETWIHFMLTIDYHAGSFMCLININEQMMALSYTKAFLYFQCYWK